MPRSLQDLPQSKILAAVKRFARSKPFRGELAERQAKFAALHRELLAIVAPDGPSVDLIFEGLDAGEWPRGNGRCKIVNGQPALVLEHKLSIVTYLWLFAGLCGLRRSDRFAFARDLFRQCFPRSFARARVLDGMIVSPERRAE